jgi:20S proteasome alpha/beta subunit
MGWNDREPYFSMIESRMDEDGMTYDEALEAAVDTLREAADQRRKEVE